MIELHRVWKVFAVGPVKVPALSDVSFRVAKGEFVTLHGASGAGKTTLLRLLYREELPTEGEIEVLDYDVPALRVREVAELRRSIGVVFQDAKLLPGRTVYENVAFVLRVLGTPRREITPRVFDALRAVGLSSRAQAYPAQLSQGEAQRAALARAIARNPLLLLADEPTGSLDDTMAAEVVDIVKDIWAGGTTVLFATHQARLAAALRQRTLTLVGGRRRSRARGAGAGHAGRRRRALREQGRGARHAQAGARQGCQRGRAAAGEPAARVARGDAHRGGYDARGRARAHRAVVGAVRG